MPLQSDFTEATVNPRQELHFICRQATFHLPNLGCKVKGTQNVLRLSDGLSKLGEARPEVHAVAVTFLRLLCWQLSSAY